MSRHRGTNYYLVLADTPVASRNRATFVEMNMTTVYFSLLFLFFTLLYPLSKRYAIVAPFLRLQLPFQIVSRHLIEGTDLPSRWSHVFTRRNAYIPFPIYTKAGSVSKVSIKGLVHASINFASRIDLSLFVATVFWHLEY